MTNCEQENRCFILDTSLFTNPNTRSSFGKTTLEAVINFLKIAEQAKHLNFLMPTSIKRELTTFLDGEEIPFLETHINVKSPALYDLKVPAAVVYKFIDEIRNRINKGLRIAEQVIREEKESDIEIRIHKLRDKYREALRDGVVDSKEDFDVLMLASEVKGLIVTADYGLMKMAEWLGIPYLNADKFHELLIYESKIDLVE